MKPSFPFPSQGASEVVDKYTTSISATFSSTPDQNFEENQNCCAGCPLDVVDQYAPGTSATCSLDALVIEHQDVLNEIPSSPPHTQDSRSSKATNATSPTPLDPVAPKKRKRSDDEADSSVGLQTPRKKPKRNSPWHRFPQPGSLTMIVNGEPRYVTEVSVSPEVPASSLVPGLAPVPTPTPVPAAAQASAMELVPAPAPVPALEQAPTMAQVPAPGQASERYLDSNRLRQMVKTRLVETVGVNEGAKWQCRLNGGTYLIECLRDGLCSMQWFGEIVFV